VPILHADDCGLSAGMTDGIVTCFDRGWLHRTSVVANGTGWNHAVAALKRRPGLSVALHINLFEGQPLAEAADVHLLVDRQGRFHRGFVALWARGLAGAGSTRVRGQVRLEMRRQIERFLDAFGDRGPLTVDGHVHYHVIPFVLDELLALAEEYPISAIRLPRELLYWPLRRTAPRPRMTNVVKNIVLRGLSRRAERVLGRHAVKTTEAFVGVLGTGAMTLQHVRAALDHLSRAGTVGTVEILFHPGRAAPHEAVLWKDRPELQSTYLSIDRDREAELLCSDALGEVLRAYGAPPDETTSAVRSKGAAG
jgi:predicted glycoside hydrolase/deacetylase ChbG (UPF0249 family)